MSLVRPLNILMTFVWIVALFLVSSPIVNPWAQSALSQEALLREQKIDTDNFDFGYLRFKLGRYGDAALERLYNDASHPEASTIRREIDRVQAAENYYQLKYPSEATEPQQTAPGDVESGPMGLELNPEGAPTENDTP